MALYCKSCSKPIKFIRTEKGRNMPVDIKPVTVITSLGKTIKAFTPHWASCSGASQFRKKSTDGGQHRAV